MKIYKLTSKKTNEIYVGKTVETLYTRFRKHKTDYRRWLKGLGHFKSSYFLTEYDDVNIELIEETNNSLREIYWIHVSNCCNFEHNNEHFLITKVNDKECTQGFRWRFTVQKDKQRLVRKRSVDLDVVIEFRDKWLELNKDLFISD